MVVYPPYQMSKVKNDIGIIVIKMVCVFYLTFSVSFLIFHFVKENRFSSCLLETNENLM